jgi:fluoride exporter
MRWSWWLVACVSSAVPRLAFAAVCGRRTVRHDDARSHPVTRFLLICLGGAAGTGARFAVQNLAATVLGAAFPYGTIAVNVIGSFLIGAVMYASMATELDPTLRLVLTTGFLGGFTTYSAFNYETFALLENGALGRATVNVAVTLVACLAAGFAGNALARRLLGA